MVWYYLNTHKIGYRKPRFTNERNFTDTRQLYQLQSGRKCEVQRKSAENNERNHDQNSVVIFTNWNDGA